ncbi:hypothetical protein VPH35_123928 [Triticum aestivum]
MVFFVPKKGVLCLSGNRMLALCTQAGSGCVPILQSVRLSIRGFAETSNKEVVKPELGTNFDSLTEVYDFYNLYSWEHGFEIRYGESRLNPEKKEDHAGNCVCRCSGKLL